MVARAARQEVDTLHRRRDLCVDADLALDDVSLGQVDAAAQRILDRTGLFVDLLEPEMLVTALFRLRGVPRDRSGFTSHPFPGERADLGSGGREASNLALFEQYHPLGVGQDGGDIARAERLAFTETDDQGGRV